jgi:hypothetical protein
MKKLSEYKRICSEKEPERANQWILWDCHKIMKNCMELQNKKFPRKLCLVP